MQEEVYKEVTEQLCACVCACVQALGKLKGQMEEVPCVVGDEHVWTSDIRYQLSVRSLLFTTVPCGVCQFCNCNCLPFCIATM